MSLKMGKYGPFKWLSKLVCWRNNNSFRISTIHGAGCWFTYLKQKSMLLICISNNALHYNYLECEGTSHCEFVYVGKFIKTFAWNKHYI